MIPDYRIVSVDRHVNKLIAYGGKWLVTFGVFSAARSSAEFNG